MTCVEVRDILSDLIDVRNGEIPPVGASRLSEPEVRADAESHLAGCAECRAELIVMEEVGNAFADFNVGELPAQHFADYGAKARERMARPSKIVPLRPARRGWWMASGAAAAAACVAFAVVQFMPKKPGRVNPIAKTPAVQSNRPEMAAARMISNPELRLPTSFVSTSGSMTQGKRGNYNPSNPTPTLDKLLKDEENFRYIIMAEDAPWGPDQLLGVALRTTRDQDQDLSKRGSLGLRVIDIAPNSVAGDMGLRQRDVITAVNGVMVDSGGADDALKFLAVLKNLGKGATLRLDIIREDKLGILYTVRSGVLGKPQIYEVMKDAK